MFYVKMWFQIQVSKDEHSNIFWMDSEAERIFRISLDSAIGKPIQILLPNIQTEANKVKNTVF